MTATHVPGIYTGSVSHRRKLPFEHRLRYRNYSLLVDIDALDRLAAETRLLSHNRWNLFSIHDRDYGPRDGSPLRAWIDSQLRTAGIDLGGGEVHLLAFPRILGYTFNPLTIWFCYHRDGSLRAILYEIHNTFGHSHSHLIPIAADSAEPLRHGFAKVLHVSPFFDRDGSYSFTVRPPRNRFSVSIDYRVDNESMLTATMVGDHRPLAAGSLLRVFFTHPLLTMKVTFGIHWNALKVLLKGGRYRTVPEPPSHPVSLAGRFDPA
jgi:DUF1365 family protein